MRERLELRFKKPDGRKRGDLIEMTPITLEHVISLLLRDAELVAWMGQYAAIRDSENEGDARLQELEVNGKIRLRVFGSLASLKADYTLFQYEVAETMLRRIEDGEIVDPDT